MNDYKYFEDKASELALKQLKVKCLEAQIQGDIVPDLVFELLDNEIEKWKKQSTN